MNQLIPILLGIVAFFVGITYLLWRVAKRVKLAKYTPALLCLIAGVYYLHLAKTVQVNGGFEDLANFLLAIILLTGFASGLATCLILDFVVPKSKSK